MRTDDKLDHVEVSPTNEDERAFLLLFYKQMLEVMNSNWPVVKDNLANRYKICGFFQLAYNSWVTLGRPTEWETMRRRLA